MMMIVDFHSHGYVFGPGGWENHTDLLLKT
jgi:hypothetical protein